MGVKENPRTKKPEELILHSTMIENCSDNTNEDAMENLELDKFQLSAFQKNAIDKELECIANNPNYLIKWDDVRHLFSKK